MTTRSSWITVATFLLLTNVISVRDASAASLEPATAPYQTSTSASGNSYGPVFSGNGRFIAFVSHANNLVTNDDLGPYLDLFVRDLVTSNTVLVTVSTNGFGGANDNVALYTVATNGPLVAFESRASNLVPGDTNRFADIFVRDTASGITRLVSINVEGTGPANGPSSNPLISEDGRYVIFESLASNLVTNDFNGTNDIFIRDLQSGTTELASLNSDGTASPDGRSHSPAISAGGSIVAFVSHATNLVNGVTNRLGEVYARDIIRGTNIWAMASHLSVTKGYPPTHHLGPYAASEPTLSADGRFVAFRTLGQPMRFDLQRPTNILFTISPDTAIPPTAFRQYDNPRPGGGWPTASPIALTRDGRFLCYATPTNISSIPLGLMRVDFEELVTHVSPPDPIPREGFLVLTNVAPWAETIVTNVHSSVSGLPLHTWTEISWTGITADGNNLLFLANATNLVRWATNRQYQLYSVHVPSRAIQLISTSGGDLPGPDLGRIAPTLSPFDSRIAWDSPSDTVVAGDDNRAWDIFLRHLVTGKADLVSRRQTALPATTGMALSKLELNPRALSANGRHIAMLSLDSNLTPDDTNYTRDLIVRDTSTDSNIRLSLISTFFGEPLKIAAPSLSADGRFVAFLGETLAFVSNTNRTIYWRDLLAPTNRLVVGNDNQNNPEGVSLPVLSPSGRLVAFASRGIHDLINTDGNNAHDVFVRHMTPEPGLSDFDCYPEPGSYAPMFVSTAWGQNVTANDHSIDPAFSPDSSWILFRSVARNLLEVPLPNQTRHQLYARTVRITNDFILGCRFSGDKLVYSPTRLISYNTVAASSTQGGLFEPLYGGAANPRFSGDSRYVAFESSSNLIYRHFLAGEDVVTITSEGGLTLTNRARLTNDLVCTECANPTLNADGSIVAYETRRFVGPNNDVFVKNLQTGQTELISVNVDGQAGNASAHTPLISPDARFVVFASKASNLVPGDHNQTTDIFLRDRVAGVTHCLSRSAFGTGTGNRVSSNPIMSADGRAVAFQSFASDLMVGDYNDTRDVFLVTLSGPDDDGDGMDDDWEVAYFNTTARDGSGDSDNDGASDLAEYRAGTNPSNGSSILRVISISTTDIGTLHWTRRRTTLLWSAAPGKAYRVEYKYRLEDDWNNLPNEVVSGGTTATTLHEEIFSAATPHFERAFYRVVLVQ